MSTAEATDTGPSGNEAPGNEAGMAGTSARPSSATTRQAVTVVVVLAVAVVVFVVYFAFGTSNTPQTVDGSTATSSHFIGGS